MAIGLVLHGSPHSQFTYKVALMLRLSGASFRFRYVSFQKGMHKTPEFRALSRWGQVPVLEHAGRSLCQSGAILEYLADALGRFGGGDAAARAAIREWLFWNADRLAPPVYGCYGVKLGELKLLPIAFEPAVVAYFRAGAAAAFASLDAWLDGRDFLAAPEPTIADICCYGEAAFAERSDIDLGAWPNVRRWADRVAALPGFNAPFDLLGMADAAVA